MKKLLFAIFIFLPVISQAKFKSDYITATSSLTVQGPMVATGTLTFGGILTNLNGTYKVTETAASGGSYSAFVAGSVADYTVSQTTNGAGSNMFYSNIDGDHVWGHHVNLSTLSDGGIGYATGLHGVNNVGLFVVDDSTCSIPIHIFQNSSISTAPMIAIDLETDYRNAVYPGSGGSIVYNGTSNGNAIQLWKRGINQFIVDSSGTITTYDTLGTSNMKMWHNTSGGIIQTNNSKPISFLSATGAVDFYSASLTQLLDVAVDSGGAATFDALGSTITLGGSAATDKVVLAGVPKFFSNAAPRTNITPNSVGEIIINTGQTPIEVCVSTSASAVVGAAAAKLSWALITNRSTACSN